VAMVSLAIVAAFLLLMVLSGTGLIAKDWSREVGVNYAPPSFVGADPRLPATRPRQLPRRRAAPKAKRRRAPGRGSAGRSAGCDSWGTRGETQKSETGVLPPTRECRSLADVMADIRAKGSKAEAVEARAATLPFGGDKWGRDVLKKVIKGSETSIFVGLAAAVVATFLGTLFGAIAGYYGRWLDDIFNWFLQRFLRRYRICC